jgi:glutaconate CoA-transferase subunit A
VPADKLLSLKEAVATLIRDGDSVLIGACLESNIPFAVTYEIIRQAKRGLNMMAPISDASTDILIGAGCAAAITGAWAGNVSGGLGHNYRRAAEHDQPQPIRVHDYSNFSMGMALMAGAYGMPFVPVRSLLGSDLLKSNPALRLIDDPTLPGGVPFVAVPPLRPDVAVLAVQRADRDGNCHLWGNLGLAQEAALAARHVIVLAEDIAAPEAIASDPNRVLFPAFAVAAVVHEPGGVHPSPMAGLWRRDHDFFGDYHRRSRDPAGFQTWLREWVLDLPDHRAYRAKLGARLDDLRIKGEALAAPANFASA